MRTRSKALTLIAAMIAAFAILPALGAAADELPPGQYEVLIEGETYDLVVSDSTCAVDTDADVLLAWECLDGAVQNLLELTVGDETYEVVFGDGETTATGTVQDPEPEASPTSTEVPGDGESEEPGDDESEVPGDGESEEPGDDESEEPGDDETEEATTEATEASHGEIVSTVARCAPTGRTAREAGLPNHGFFVSATARGETDVEVVVGETTFGPYDLSTQDGADQLCDDVPAMLTAEADADAAVDEEEDGEKAETSDETRRAPGRSGDAPGRSGDAPGRSGDAPGQLKKNG